MIAARLRATRGLALSIWESSPGLTLLCSLFTVVQAVSAYTFIVAGSDLVTRIRAGAEAGDLWGPLAVLLASLVAFPVAEAQLDASALALQARFTARQQVEIARASLAPAGTAHLDDPAVIARIEGLTEQARGYLSWSAMTSVWTYVATRAAGIAGIVAVARWSVLAAVVLAVAFLAASGAFTHYLDVVLRDLADGQDVELRRAGYYRSVLVESSSAREVRLFGMAPWTLGRFTRQWHLAMAAVWARRSAALRPLLITTLLITGVVGCVTLWLASEAWRGDIADTVLLVAVQGIAQMVALGPLGDTTVNVRRVQATESAIRQLRTDLGGTVRRDALGAEDARNLSAAAVSMTGVDFTYPAGTDLVLQGLDLVVEPGTSLGVVGVNGAGKSTIVKLLCGLYEPGAGSVTIDRMPAVDAVARGRVAVVLQDFVRYRRSLRDNLRFAPEDGAAHPGTDDHVRWLTQAGGAEMLAGLPAGWDTVLDPAQEGGTDLSGGQWQRIALARALAAIDEGAGLLVLDEPTAALDIRSEVALFEHLLEAARGVTTILVSHRLSSVRRTDRIVVVDGGAIVEDGSHDQLMAADGVYAEAFRLQASRFAEEVPHA